MFWVTASAINKYVATTGNDANAGTIGSPYLTLGKAATVAINSGDSIIVAAGTYNQITQVIVAPGVSIRGAGQWDAATGTRINLIFTVSGSNTFNSAAIQLVSATENTLGNQSITRIWFDGNNFACLSGILIRCRRSVTVQYCRFTNFGVQAINLNGKLSNNPGTPPTTFSTGNQVLNCSFTDCSDRITQAANSVSCGSISYAGQADLLFQYDTLSNTGKAPGHNGNLFGAVQGNNKAVKWFYCIMTKPAEQNDGYNFGIESWYDMGGCEFAFNTYTGGGNAIDIGYGGANKGAFANSWYIHDNIFQNAALTNYSGSGGTVGSIAVQFEPSTFIAQAPQNATAGDAIIINNYLNRIGTLVKITLGNYSLDHVNRIYINHNVCENMGYINSTYSGIFSFAMTNGTKIDSIFIDNNTLLGSTLAGSPKGIIILDPKVGLISNIFFRNNIVENALGYGYFVLFGNNACDRIFSQNNIAFQNAFSNNAPYYLLTTIGAGSFVVGKTYTIANAGSTNFVAIGAANNNPGTVFTASGAGSGTGSATIYIVPTNSTFTNVAADKVNPQFVSATAPTDLHLAPGSPACTGGLNPPATYRGAYPCGTITPTITWNNPSAIIYGTALSGTQLNATSGGVPGTFVYTPASGTILNAGTQTLSVIFTPTDQSTYSVVSKQVTIIVNQATATLTYSNLTQTYTGSPLQPTVITSPAGLTVVNTTFNGTGTVPTNAGVYTVASGLTNSNYSATAISNTFTINKATATINISNLNQVYDGSPKSITASTSPVGLSGLAITYNGSSTPPTAAGSYSVIVTLTNPNYTATNATGTLTIAKATPTVIWSTPSAITYPTALSGTQLNATASVAGSFSYSPPSGTILNAGTSVLSVNFTPTDAANYNSVLNTTVSIVVNKGTATISLSNLAQTYDGSQKSVIATTSPAGLNTVTILYNGSSTPPTNAGSYSIIASLSNSNYNATNATGTLVVAKETATLSLSNTVQTYNATPRFVVVTTAPPGLTTVSVTYDGSPTVPTNAGTYAVVATLSNTNYQGSTSGTLTILKATPVISWSNPSSIVYGTALSGTQLNATSGGVAGSFVYTPVSGTILNAGTYNLIADFTPTDAANYNSVNGTSVSLVVTKATATITLSNLIQDYDGNPKPVTVTTNPVGLGVITTTYNGSGTAPSAIGSYSVISTLTNTNYTATNGTGTLTIQAVAANINISNINQTYTGSPLPVTVTTIPGGLPHTDTYNGSGTVPTNAGTYTVIATLNSPNVGADTATYIIAKANPVITWGNPSAITYGTALSGTELNASASVAGVFTYLPASGAILNAGTQILSTSFAPTDAANYNSIPVTTVTLVVNKAVAIITISNTTQTFDGTQKSVTITTNPVGLTVISTTYNGSATPPSAVGTYAVVSSLNNSNYTATPANDNLVISTTSAGISISNLSQTYTGLQLPVTVTTNPTGISHTVTYNGSSTIPTNAGTYTVIATLTGGTYTGADTQTLVISKATPVITWPNPASIAYGTALSGTQLNASTTVAGVFVYSPVSGTVLNVGTQNLSVTFTPTDGSNYNVVTKIVPITVTSASTTLTLSNLAATYNGTPKPVTVVTSPAGLSGVTILYNGSSTPPTNAGSYTVNVTLTNPNYTASPVTGTLVIAKALPILSWSLPAQITYPAPLTSIQLNATANVAGTFTYSPVAGTILNPGTSSLVATFHPTDLVNYTNNTTITVPLVVAGSPVLDFMILHSDEIYRNLP